MEENKVPEVVVGGLRLGDLVVRLWLDSVYYKEFSEGEI